MAFEGTFRRFTDFLSTSGSGPLEPIQCEVSYINHIPRTKGVWSKPGDLAKLLSIAGSGRMKFLPPAEGFELRASYLIHDESSNPLGRLHVAAQQAFARATKEPLLLLNLTARCKPPGKDTDAVLAGMDLCREWIVKGFVDITTATAQKAWGRKADD